ADELAFLGAAVAGRSVVAPVVAFLRRSDDAVAANRLRAHPAVANFSLAAGRARLERRAGRAGVVCLARRRAAAGLAGVAGGVAAHRIALDAPPRTAGGAGVAHRAVLRSVVALFVPVDDAVAAEGPARLLGAVVPGIDGGIPTLRGRGGAASPDKKDPDQPE